MRYRIFKLVYENYESLGGEKFMRCDIANGYYANIISLSFSNSSSNDIRTIIARCKMELKEKGYFSGEPTQIFEYVEGKGYQFLK